MNTTDQVLFGRPTTDLEAQRELRRGLYRLACSFDDAHALLVRLRGCSALPSELERRPGLAEGLQRAETGLLVLMGWAWDAAETTTPERTPQNRTPEVGENTDESTERQVIQ